MAATSRSSRSKASSSPTTTSHSPQASSAADGAVAVIDESYSIRRDQTLVASRTLEVQGRKFHLRIESDSYDFQCSARIEVWDPVQSQWNFVHAIPYGLMKTPKSLVYKADKSNPASARMSFEDDFKALLAVALKIVF